MSAATRAVATVSRLAAGQWGLLTTAQAEREGVTRLQLARLADADILERVERGVYATTSSSTEHRALRAAWLALDPTRTAEERLADPINAGVASHTSAAGLHRLGDLLDDTPEITLPHRKQSRRGIRLHRLALTDSDVTLVDGLPTTTEERTVADLLRDGHDPEHVAQIIGQGTRRGAIDLTDLAVRVEPSARRHGQPDGHALVEHLLDLVGLSPTALARDLANSSVGRELVAAGQLAGAMSALKSLNDAASAVPQFDTSKLLGLDKLVTNAFTGIDVGKVIGLTDGLDSVKAFETPLTSVLSPQLRSVLASTNTPAFRALIAAAQSPSIRAAQKLLDSDVGRATRAAARHTDVPDAGT